MGKPEVYGLGGEEGLGESKVIKREVSWRWASSGTPEKTLEFGVGTGSVEDE